MIFSCFIPKHGPLFIISQKVGQHPHLIIQLYSNSESNQNSFENITFANYEDALYFTSLITFNFKKGQIMLFQEVQNKIHGFVVADVLNQFQGKEVRNLVGEGTRISLW